MGTSRENHGRAMGSYEYGALMGRYGKLMAHYGTLCDANGMLWEAITL